MAQYCTFFLGDKAFGLEILRIQEIVRSQEITPVAGAPAFVEGLINLRGQIVIAMSLRKLCMMDTAGASSDPVHIILPADGEALSLMADRCGDVLDFGDEPLILPPAHLGSSGRLIQGVLKLPGGLLHVIDPEKIFEDRKSFEPKHLTSVSSQEPL